MQEENDIFVSFFSLLFNICIRIIDFINDDKQNDKIAAKFQ